MALAKKTDVSISELKKNVASAKNTPAMQAQVVALKSPVSKVVSGPVQMGPKVAPIKSVATAPVVVNPPKVEIKPEIGSPGKKMTVQPIVIDPPILPIVPNDGIERDKNGNTMPIGGKWKLVNGEWVKDTIVVPNNNLLPGATVSPITSDVPTPIKPNIETVISGIGGNNLVGGIFDAAKNVSKLEQTFDNNILPGEGLIKQATTLVNNSAVETKNNMLYYILAAIVVAIVLYLIFK